MLCKIGIDRYLYYNILTIANFEYMIKQLCGLGNTNSGMPIAVDIRGD